MARGRNTETEEPTAEDVVPEPTPADASEPAEKANDQNTATSKKDPLPAGWSTPTGLSKLVELKPQQCYGYVKNGKEFPSAIHTDGRTIVPTPEEEVPEGGFDTVDEITPERDNPLADARAWILDRRAKTAQAKAAKAAKEAAEAAAAEAKPEVESEPSTEA